MFCDLLQKEQISSCEIILKGKFSEPDIPPCSGGRKRSKDELGRYGRRSILVFFFFFLVTLYKIGNKTEILVMHLLKSLFLEILTPKWSLCL